MKEKYIIVLQQNADIDYAETIREYLKRLEQENMKLLEVKMVEDD